jgi:hypothetical protein
LTPIAIVSATTCRRHNVRKRVQDPVPHCSRVFSDYSAFPCHLFFILISLALWHANGPTSYQYFILSLGWEITSDNMSGCLSVSFE